MKRAARRIATNIGAHGRQLVCRQADAGRKSLSRTNTRVEHWQIRGVSARFAAFFALCRIPDTCRAPNGESRAPARSHLAVGTSYTSAEMITWKFYTVPSQRSRRDRQWSDPNVRDETRRLSVRTCGTPMWSGFLLTRGAEANARCHDGRWRGLHQSVVEKKDPFPVARATPRTVVSRRTAVRDALSSIRANGMSEPDPPGAAVGGDVESGSFLIGSNLMAPGRARPSCPSP